MMADTICDTCVRVREGLCDGEKELTACQYYKGMTNFDKYFRFTSAERLSEFLAERLFTMFSFCSVVQNNQNPGFCDLDCKKCVAEWLKQEVGNDTL